MNLTLTVNRSINLIRYVRNEIILIVNLCYIYHLMDELGYRSFDDVVCFFFAWKNVDNSRVHDTHSHTHIHTNPRFSSHARDMTIKLSSDKIFTVRNESRKRDNERVRETESSGASGDLHQFQLVEMKIHDGVCVLCMYVDCFDH